MHKGLHTKRNAWDEAYKLKIYRGGELIDPGVNYFVLMLDQMGLATHFSCEGHPNGFYIAFSASYGEALAISDAGYFTVEIEREDYWILRNSTNYTGSPREKIDAMRFAAEAWEKRFGPLDFEKIVTE
jgi:hypothetical protein